MKIYTAEVTAIVKMVAEVVEFDNGYIAEISEVKHLVEIEDFDVIRKVTQKGVEGDESK